MAGSELVVRIRDSSGADVPNFIGSTSNPSVTSEKSPGNIATGQVAVTTSATLVVPARTARKSVTLTPTSSVVYNIGTSGVTTSTGVYVPAGASITLSTTAEIYAVAPVGFTLSYVETF